MNNNQVSNKTFKELIQCLEQEIGLYQEMSKAIQNKQNAIVSGDIEKLREYVSSEKSFIKESMELAEGRKNIQSRISDQFKLDNREPKLKLIIEIAPPREAIQLSNLRYRLKAVLNDITRINNENRLLLDFSIEHVKGMAHLFLNIKDEDHDIYDMDGVVKLKNADNKMLDYQI